MSTINEALKRAQKERDTRYEKYSGVRSANRKERSSFPGRSFWWTSLALIIIFLAFASYSWLDLGALLPSAITQVIKSRQSQDFIQRPAKDRRGPQNGKSRSNASKHNGPGTAPQPEGAIDAKEYYNRARLFHKSGRLQDAGRMYREALTADPGHVDALNNLGVIYIHEKDYRAARINFEKAIRLKQGYAEPHYNLACLYAAKGELMESLAHLKKALSLDQSVREWARKDTDLANLRGMPEFDGIIRQD